MNSNSQSGFDSKEKIDPREVEAQMRFQAEVAEVIEDALSKWPPVDAIAPAAEDFPVAWYIGDVVKIADNTQRLEALQTEVAKYESQLAKSRELYTHARQGDVSGLSRYDRDIAYSGNLLSAIAGTLRGSTNHIAFDLRVIAALKAHIDTTAQAVALDRAQIALF